VQLIPSHQARALTDADMQYDALAFDHNVSPLTITPQVV
jgi:hypothetical protein